MLKKGIKLVAGFLAAAVVMTTVPADVFTATEEDTYVWDIEVGFTAGAHHAIEDTVAITEKEEEYIVIAIENGERVSFQQFIDEQPTAYDVDKVVDKLESKIAFAERVMVKNPHDALDKVANDTAESFIEAYKEAIETIKAGGKE